MDERDDAAAELEATRRAAAMELLLVAPALSLFLLGAVGWGGYFSLANRLQHVAEAAAEAAALAPAEAREGAAWTGARAALAQERLRAESLELLMEGAGGPLTLQLAYDASREPVFKLGEIVPMPMPHIVRRAQVEAR